MLDWLGDLGGLSGALFTIATMLLSYINFQRFNSYMVSRLYAMTEAEVDEKFNIRSIYKKNKIINSKKIEF